MASIESAPLLSAEALPGVNPAALRRQQARTLLLLIVGYAGYYLCRANLSVVLPLILKEFGGRGILEADARVRMGAVVSIGTMAYAGGKLVAGFTGDLGGGRRNFLFGMSGAIVCTLLFTLGGVTAVPIFTLAWAGNRFAQSFGWPGMVKIAGRSFPFQTYGLVVGLLSLSFQFGDAAARASMGLLLGAGVSWRGVCVVDAAVLSVWLVVTYLLLREKPAALGNRDFPPAPSNLYTAEPEPRSGVAGLLLPLLRSPAFLLACVLSLAMTLLREMFNTWTPTFFVEMLKLSAAAAAKSSAYFPLLGGVSVIVAGWLSDKLGRGGRAIIIVVGMLLTGFALYAIGGMRPERAAAGVTLVAAAGFLITGPYSYLAGAISLDFGGARGAATACSLIDAVGYLAGTLAGDTVARVVRRSGWPAAFHDLAFVAWIAAGVGALFWITQLRRPAAA